MKNYNSLEDFLFKNVIMTDIYGNVNRGKVGLFETPYENESDEESIGVCGVEYYESEIESIVIDEEMEKKRREK